jgi:hypothetical protein
MANIIKEELEEVFLKHEGTIAVVGNGVFGKQYGKEIDEHDAVIRFNNFKISGYKKYVGQKVTWWCTHPYIENYEHFYNTSISHRKYKQYKVNGVIIIPKHDYWQEYRDEFYKVLSSGMTILLILDKLGINADAYGFDHFKTGHYFNHSHKRRDLHTYENEVETRKKLTHITWKE